MKRTAQWGTLALLVACQGRLDQQPRFSSYQSNSFFNDNASDRPEVEGTVASNDSLASSSIREGFEGGKAVTNIPIPVTRAVLQRGQERFNIYCSACHGRSGDGNGMVVQRGFTAPPSFHSERLRIVPPGYIFNVITRGFGAMYSYADRVPVSDRWAIIAYIRALQFSRQVPQEDLSPEDLRKIEEASP